ncbi:group II intron maturase-specific domain-containing protein [Nocardia sp. GAS34]|uniref:group II intron maturase-specific domain-containing protein n=1 Tax=unclassified Nocardia TaxID=2637762 RepID=UPI003D1C926C
MKTKVRALTSRLSQQSPRDILIQLNRIMRGWSNYFRHAVAKHTLGRLETIVWWRVVRWWKRLHRWRWKDIRRHLMGRNGQWRKPSADGIELFNLAAVPVTRYRYRGNTIPTPGDTVNRA